MKESLVSVMVPIYNAERYLHQCLNSIQTQTYKNLEVILINDGSTDKSQEICEQYCKNDRRYSMYSIPNSGPGGGEITHYRKYLANFFALLMRMIG